MRRHGAFLLGILILSLTLTSVAFGRDFFLFDLEKNKMLFMGTNDAAFTEKMDLEKVPDLIMPTYDPNKYLAVYMPEKNLDDGRFRIKKGEDYNAFVDKGQLMLINISNGRSEDIVEIGCGPYRTAFSKDKKHFMISYRTDPKSLQFEILYYNIPEKKSEKLSEHYVKVYNLDFALDSNKAFALVQRSSDSVVETLSINPFKVTNTMAAGTHPFRVYSISENRIALLDLGWLKNKIEEPGSVKFIDTDKYYVISSAEFSPQSNVRYEWKKDQNTLLIVTREAKHDWDRDWQLIWSGQSHFIRINKDGMKDIQTKLHWDYLYQPEKDKIFVLTERNLEIYDFKTGEAVSKIKTGPNIYNEEFTKDGSGYMMTLNYFVDVLDEANLATVYSNYNGIVRFFDLTTGKALQTIKGAKMKGMYPGDFGDKASVTTNQDKSRFYVLNRARKGLTVYDNQLKQISQIDLAIENPISMYQIKKPTYQTVLATEKGLYKVEDSGIKQICKFEKESKDIFLFQEDNRLIFWVGDDEWYIIDPNTLELKFHLNEFGDPNDKYTKVKKGERRYFYVPSPNDWSE